MQHLKRFLSVLLRYPLPLYAIVFLIVFQSDLRHWSTHLPGTGADGFKNFYTVAYHLDHDVSAWHFDGMNYPYGEHVLYTDNQPLVSNTLRWMGVRRLQEKPWLLPLLIVLSGALAAWLLYATLRLWSVPKWFALIAGFGIALLSPQWLRLTGHYSLAYAFVLPFTFYLLARALTGAKWAWWVSGLWLFLSGFIHPYFLPMQALLALALAAVQIVRALQHRISWRPSLAPVMVAVVPLLAFQTVVTWQDGVVDRPEAPYGFIPYSAPWSSILTPSPYSWSHLIPENWGPSLEGPFYIGLFAIIGSIAGLIAIARRGKTLSTEHLLLFAAVPVLLLATAFPFTIWKFDRLLDLTGPLRQFRGIGRFSFVFFYASNLFAAAVLGKWIASASLKSARFWFAGSLVVVLLAESLLWQSNVSGACRQGEQVLSETHNTFEQVDPSNYQAILPLPWYHVGSENFRTPDHPAIQAQSMRMSLQWGLPLAAVQLSRTSLTHSLKLFEVTHALTVHPTWLEDLPSDQPLLLLASESDSLSEAAESLIEHATFLLARDGFAYYHFPISAFDDIRQEAYLTAARDTSCLDYHAVQKDTNFLPYVDDFEDRAANEAFRGSGALTFSLADWTPLIPGSLPFENNVEYEISFWCKAAPKVFTTQISFWEQQRTEVGWQDVQYRMDELSDHVAAVRGSWVLIRYSFRCLDASHRFLLLAHRENETTSVTIDQLMIRPKKDCLRDRTSNDPNRNNLYFEPPTIPIVSSTATP